jgi:hypothetical protein
VTTDYLGEDAGGGGGHQKRTLAAEGNKGWERPCTSEPSKATCTAWSLGGGAGRATSTADLSGGAGRAMSTAD